MSKLPNTSGMTAYRLTVKKGLEKIHAVRDYFTSIEDAGAAADCMKAVYDYHFPPSDAYTVTVVTADNARQNDTDTKENSR